MPSQPRNSFNPFAPLDPTAAVIRDMLMARIAEAEPSPFWQGRAAELAATIARPLAWVKDAKGVDLNSGEVMTLLQFDALAALGRQDQAQAPDIGSCDLADLPIEATEGIRAYLAGLPGYDPLHPSPENSQARQIHGYALYVLRQQLA